MNPKVTVYITCYNYGRFVDEAIQSVLNQTYKNFELIIIDDDSTDDSRDVISKYQDLDNVKIILHVRHFLLHSIFYFGQVLTIVKIFEM